MLHSGWATWSETKRTRRRRMCGSPRFQAGSDRFYTHTSLRCTQRSLGSSSASPPSPSHQTAHCPGVRPSDGSQRSVGSRARSSSGASGREMAGSRRTAGCGPTGTPQRKTLYGGHCPPTSASAWSATPTLGILLTMGTVPCHGRTQSSRVSGPRCLIKCRRAQLRCTDSSVGWTASTTSPPFCFSRSPPNFNAAPTTVTFLCTAR
mmetsp:Transcript_29493/g.88314  ORF Transcript_29493/g.88314 Transcript_29493/m.88314 type:complete len:206 (+) Transcript_29493:100-717(+)